MSIVYDAGALIAADRSDRQMWADHRARLELVVIDASLSDWLSSVDRL